MRLSFFCPSVVVVTWFVPPVHFFLFLGHPYGLRGLLRCDLLLTSLFPPPRPGFPFPFFFTSCYTFNTRDCLHPGPPIVSARDFHWVFFLISQQSPFSPPTFPGMAFSFSIHSPPAAEDVAFIRSSWTFPPFLWYRLSPCGLTLLPFPPFNCSAYTPVSSVVAWLSGSPPFFRTALTLWCKVA